MNEFSGFLSKLLAVAWGDVRFGWQVTRRRHLRPRDRVASGIPRLVCGSFLPFRPHFPETSRLSLPPSSAARHEGKAPLKFRIREVVLAPIFERGEPARRAADERSTVTGSQGRAAGDSSAGTLLLPRGRRRAPGPARRAVCGAAARPSPGPATHQDRGLEQVILPPCAPLSLPREWDGDSAYP